MTSHIQIGDVSPRIQYTADGLQTLFTYPFPIFKNDDLEVYLDDTLQSTGFTVSGSGDSNGGSVTFDTAPASALTVTLRRQLAIQRTSDFQEGGEIRASVLNDELDYQTAALQQVSDDLRRSVRLGPTAPSSVDPTLPEAEADKVLTWNATGTALENKNAADFVGPTGATGATGPAGADGIDGSGLFAGTEATVTVADDDRFAILDDSDSDNPKYVTRKSLRTEAATALGNLNGATTLHCIDGLFQTATMTGSFTLTAPDDTDEGQISLLLTNDATGG